MKRSLTGTLIVALSITLAAGTFAAQRGRKPRNGAGTALPPATATPAGNQQANDEPELSGDPRIQKLQKTYVIELARLAKDYERKNDNESARGCYEQILRAVPNHPDAKASLEKIREEEKTKEKKKLVVTATEGWQDAGINVIADRTFSVRAEGTWTFKLEHVLDADGIEIPEDLKDFNLGSLVGKIVAPGDKEDSVPFKIGKQGEFTPDKSGRLLLRMYDSDPSDNKGRLNVEIQGTFEKAK